MIIGGASAGARAGSERAGYATSYLPMSARIIPAALRSAIDNGSQLQYVCSARIRNVAGTAWVDLPTVNYFQVTRDLTGSQDSGDMTVSTPETWSPYLGTYTDLLKPSNRQVQITAGIRIGATTYSERVFSGIITEYQEPHGASGGSINLRLADAKQPLARLVSAAVAPAAATAFRVFLMQERSDAYFSYGPGNLWQTTIFRFNDIEIEDTTASLTFGANILRIMEQMIPGAPLLAIKGSGVLTADIDSKGAGETGGAFSYTDANSVVVTRAGGGKNYNAVRTYGKVLGVGTTSEVADAADVALRGKLYYPEVWGSPDSQLADSNIAAAEFIASSLRGKLSLELLFNPWIEPGMRISYSSTRLNLTGTARVRRVNHQYSLGRARTYLRDLEIVP